MSNFPWAVACIGARPFQLISWPQWLFFNPESSYCWQIDVLLAQHNRGHNASLQKPPVVRETPQQDPRSVQAHRLIPMLQPQTPKAPHDPATAQCPPQPEPCSILLSAQQCSLLGARFSPLSSAHISIFCKPFLSFFICSQVPFPLRAYGELITALIQLTTFSSLWSVCLTSCSFHGEVHEEEWPDEPMNLYVGLYSFQELSVREGRPKYL